MSLNIKKINIVLLFLFISSFLSQPLILAKDRGKFWIESVQGRKHYSIGRLNKYAFVYTDRDYVFTHVPNCLLNEKYIQTVNADKFSTGSQHLTIYSRVPLLVYIGYDSRYRTKPNWLRDNFGQVPGLHLVMGEPKYGKTQVTYTLFKRRFPAGRIVLGGNFSNYEKANYSMYSVILVETSTSKEKCRQ